MMGLLKLIPLDAARRALGAMGPAAGDPSGTRRTAPRGPEAVAMFAPWSRSPRWQWGMQWLTDAQVADWPIVAPRDDATTDQSTSRSR